MPYANGSKLVECLDCGTNITFKHMKQHVARYHGPNALSCSLCKYYATSNAELKEHISINHEEMSKLQCSMCNNTFKSYLSLTCHKKLAHGYVPKQCNPVACSVCGVIITQHNMKKHVTCFHGLVPTPM